MDTETSFMTVLERQPAEAQKIGLSHPGSSKYQFFSFFPLEIRNHIYGYLAPNRIHLSIDHETCTNPDKRSHRNLKVNPWCLVRVSPLFTSELRRVVYAKTVIAIHVIDSYQGGREAWGVYKAWFENLEEEVGARIKHLTIDYYVEIDWVPDGPVPEQPHDKWMRERREERACVLAKKAEGEVLTGLEAARIKYPRDIEPVEMKVTEVGEWAIRCPISFSDAVGFIATALSKIEMRRQECGAVPGLGKTGIQELVKAYVGGTRYDYDVEVDTKPQELYRDDETDQSPSEDNGDKTEDSEGSLDEDKAEGGEGGDRD